MITKTSSIQELNKIIRSQLILQSELQSNQVMNGVSIHGQDLLERINQYAYKTYTLDSSFIVFVLENRDSSSNFSQTSDNNTLKMIASYRVHCYVYGYESQTLVNKIVARLRTEYARLALQEQGVYLESVDNIATGNDFINNTLMMRTDFYINISCEMEISQVSNSEDYTNVEFEVREI